MKSKIVALIIILASFSSSVLKAQLPHLSLYVHGLYAAALNTHSADRYSGGLGANAGLTLGSKNTRAVFSLGYTDFFAKHDSPDHILGDETYIPAKIGLRQYLPMTLHTIFIQGDLGAGFIGYKNTSETKSRFAADIGAGAHFGALEAAITFDAFKQPDYWSSWVNFQLGFNIGI
ncbi:MAG TPA: hypothetical protein VHB70_16390 [Parafilimonas sp.]|nr:hypothetical protein [Parafilimonas sp.]